MQRVYKALHKVHLLSHVNAIHRGLKPYACAECDYKSSRKENLRGHINAVHRGLKPYACPECDYHAPRRNLIPVHIDAVHKKSKPHACPECSFRTAHKGTLNKHIKSVHRSMTSVYEAPNKVVLFHHNDDVHRESKHHACKECNYKALQKVHLLSHINAVHRGLKPHACIECDYTSSRKENLRGHVNAVHRGLKPYACPECDYHASRRNLLKTHIDAVHKKLKPHACPECNFKTAHKCDLTVHIKCVHRRVTGVDSQDSRQCRTVSDLTQHTPSIQAIHNYGATTPCESSRADHDLNEVTGDNESRSRIIADNLPISCRLCSFKAKTLAKINFHFKVAHERAHIRDLTASNGKHFKKTRQYANKSSHTIITQTSDVSDDDERETPNKLNEHEETDNLIDLTESTDEGESDGRSAAKQYFPQTIIKGKRKRRTETKAYFCKRCEYVTTLKECLLKHIGSAHGRLENHACTESTDDGENDGRSDAEQYFSQTIIKGRRMKMTELKTYFCKRCDYVTTLKECLQKHIGSAHGRLEEHACTECELVEATSDKLLRHIEGAHRNIRPYSCKYCDSAFKTDGILNNHISFVHKDINDIPKLRGPAQMSLSDIQTSSVPIHSFNDNTLVQEDFVCANNILTMTDSAAYSPTSIANQQTHLNSDTEFHSKQRKTDRAQNTSDVSGDDSNPQSSDVVSISIIELPAINPNDPPPAEYDLTQSLRASDNDKTKKFNEQHMPSITHFPCSSCLFRAQTQTELMIHIMSDHQDDCI